MFQYRLFFDYFAVSDESAVGLIFGCDVGSIVLGRNGGWIPV